MINGDGNALRLINERDDLKIRTFNRTRRQSRKARFQIAWTTDTPPSIPNEPFEPTYYHVDTFTVNDTDLVSRTPRMAGASNTILMAFDLSNGAMTRANWGNISNTITHIYTIQNPGENYHQRFMLRWFNGNVTILNGDLNTNETMYSLNVENIRRSYLTANLAPADIGQWFIGWNATQFKIIDGDWGIAFKNWTAAANGTIMAVRQSDKTIVTVSGLGDTADHANL